MPAQVVERLQLAEAAGDGVIRREQAFNEGDRIEIVSGPLAGLRGIFLAASGAEPVHVLLDVVGRGNRATVSRREVAVATS